MSGSWFILAHLIKFPNKMNEKQLREELDAVYGSLSWKLTAPLRHLSAAVRLYIVRPLSPRLYIHHLGLYVIRRPRLLRFIEKLASVIPGLPERIQRFQDRIAQQVAAELALKEAAEPEVEVIVQPTLSANARALHLELLHMINKKA